MRLTRSAPTYDTGSMRDSGGLGRARLGALLVFGVLGSACDQSFDLPDAGQSAAVDASAPDASPVAPDAGPGDAGELIEPLRPDAGRTLSAGNLSPFTERADSERFILRGRLRSSDPSPSENSRHKLRGGFVPLSR